MRTGVPAFVVLVVGLQVADAGVMARAGLRPLLQGRSGGVVQGDSLRTPVRPLQRIDARERLLPGAREAFEVVPHAVAPLLV